MNSCHDCVRFLLCCFSLGSRFDTIFFFNDTPTTKIYTLSLHDALPIYETFLLVWKSELPYEVLDGNRFQRRPLRTAVRDRKSTRLNSSHANISYAVFCLKKKNINEKSLVDFECDFVGQMVTNTRFNSRF